MKIVPIFVDEESKEGIWSIHLDHETETEFDRFFDYVNDPGWLRLYGLRLSANCYLITGGSIKLTGNMERLHLQNELQKIDQVRTFLQKNGIDYPEDLNTFDNE